MLRSSLIAVSCLLAKAAVLSQPQVIPDAHIIDINPEVAESGDYFALPAEESTINEERSVEPVLNPIGQADDAIALDVAAEDFVPPMSGLTRNHLQLEGSGEMEGDDYRRLPMITYEQHREGMNDLCRQHKYKVTAWIACWIALPIYLVHRPH